MVLGMERISLVNWARATRGISPHGRRYLLVVGYCLIHSIMLGDTLAGESWSISTFSSDITIPLGHRCMGVLKTKANRVDDPLQAHGILIKGSEPAIVLVALDWCEVRNDSYQQWRRTLAQAAETSIERVMVCSLHQHDAPVIDAGAQVYLDSQGLQKELYDPDFHQSCLDKLVQAMKRSLKDERPLTHIGYADALVEKIASNRRVQYTDGRVAFNRYSRMNSGSIEAKADEGEIDPYLKTLVFFDHQMPVAAVSCYATHPMSHYGDGAVSGDFVAIARRRLQQETPGVKQIYLTGCSGDVTAGKYNDGAPAMRAVLADRLYVAMKSGFEKARESDSRRPLNTSNCKFSCEKLTLPFHDGESFTREAMLKELANVNQSVENRITAAMGLSSLDRVERGEPIDLPCFDFGGVKMILFPGESFIRYQLMAQSFAKPNPLIAIGFGECWTGYIPTEDAFREGFDHGWRWVAEGCEPLIEAKLKSLLNVVDPKP